ncbi:hypothetical protein LCGC14_1812010 [marine sediment metagenome]|uniref:XRE family transcriptional regulator n=1 Tax=marine sediment metagenome TaxID=412755 RepID=A0A0F9GLJ4_9ZZZZ
MTNKEIIQSNTRKLLKALKFTDEEVEEKMKHSCATILGFLRTGKPEIDEKIITLEDMALKYNA